MTTTTPSEGQPFPDFALPDADGRLRRLSDFAGRYLALYVYPKDDTPGCTKEACDFRDNAELRALGAEVVGVSRDGAGSHAQFAEKYSLSFALLSDPDAGFLKRVGAWGEQSRGGEVSEGVRRSTYLIGPDGRLVRAWTNVKVDGHADEVAGEIARDQAARA